MQKWQLFRSKLKIRTSEIRSFTNHLYETSQSIAAALLSSANEFTVALQLIWDEVE